MKDFDKNKYLSYFMARRENILEELKQVEVIIEALEKEKREERKNV